MNDQRGGAVAAERFELQEKPGSKQVRFPVAVLPRVRHTVTAR